MTDTATGSNIIDNHRPRLADRLGEFLAEGAIAARFAVGYLFLEGLLPLRPQIERLDCLEILIGNVVNRLTEEQIREEAAGRMRGGEEWMRPQEDVASSLRLHHRAAMETSLNLRRTLEGTARSVEMQELLLTLANRVAAGALKVRLYTHGRIHAKLALLEYPAGHPCGRGLAVVGSSNLTLGGDAHPTELNVVVREEESVAALSRWYGNLWAVSQDFHRELFEELGQCWAFAAPD